ncbi:MAG: 2,3-bisphosphoglycerate-independent phosphoglycerate mutase [Bacteroidetes bacterium]|nr:2,3-bisphosphoglycerate-independent phosphoglycerate mutase [Bacteroidota bacterium]
MYRKAMLIVMDGWGNGVIPEANAVAAARTPFFDSLSGRYPYSQLVTCGEAVGLPEGQMGNSEVGHLNLGAGRIVYQELQRINVAIRNGELQANQKIQEAFAEAKSPGKTLHFIGLVSDGGVHSHISHLKALLTMAQETACPRVAVHAFTDGRDVDPKSGAGFITDLQAHLKTTNGVLASVTGRYYAMDRDKRWPRVKLAYDALVNGVGTKTSDLQQSIVASYASGVTDEFIEPLIHVDAAGNPLATIKEGDVVICFNFRTDRCREITEVLTQQAFPELGMHPLALHYYTMTEYDAAFKQVGVIFQNDNLVQTLGEVLAAHQIPQIRIAETEKYPHVTFFFSGGKEAEFSGESRIMCPSPQDVATYDLKPEMSAQAITEAILPELEAERPGFVMLNFANADMVGHTGVWDAVVKAVETVDACVAQIVPVALAHDYAIFLTADHGNADFMRNADGTPNTAHSLNLVPLYLISNSFSGSLKSGKLGDIAPSILKYMGLPIPQEMTGQVLIQSA